MKKKKTSAGKAAGGRAQRSKKPLDSRGRKQPASARDDNSARNDKKRGELLYLYGISETQPAVRVNEGVDARSRVEAIECGGLVCWVSRVDAREFGAELQARLENLDWLAGASVRHQRVVAAIHEQTTVLPARFATLFLSAETLTDHVQRSLRQIREDLRRVEGADEYGIKIFAITKAAPPPTTGVSGRDYLQRKSLMLKQSNVPAVTPELQQFAAELQGIAEKTAPGGSVSGGQRNLVWQASLLVARSQRERLESTLAQFQRRHGAGYRMECTGPWPPYSFIAVKADASQR